MSDQLVDTDIREKNCARCNRTKFHYQFNKAKTKDGRDSWCKECRKEYMSDYWKDYYHRPGVKERLREKGIERMIPRYLFIYRYLLEHPCVDCGYDDPLGLDFDHVRGIKLMDISRMVRYTKRFSLSNIQREIDKCDVRCKVCHLKRGMTKKPGPSWYAYLIAMKDAGRGWENGPNWTGKSPWDK